MDGLGGIQTWCGWGILAQNSLKVARLIDAKNNTAPTAHPEPPPTGRERTTDGAARHFTTGCLSPAAADSLDAPDGPQGPKRRAERTQQWRGAGTHELTPAAQRRPGRRPSPTFSGRSS